MTDGQSEIHAPQDHPHRVLIAGPARCGKDTFAAMLSKASNGALRLGPSTSEFFCCRTHGYGHGPSVLAGYKRTAEGREQLARLIDWRNEHDLTHPGCGLYWQMVGSNIDVIAGIRRLREVTACVESRLLTCAVWVERDVPEDATLDYRPSDLLTLFGPRCYYAPNTGTLDALQGVADKVWSEIRKQKSRN